MQGYRTDPCSIRSLVNDNTLKEECWCSIVRFDCEEKRTFQALVRAPNPPLPCRTVPILPSRTPACGAAGTRGQAPVSKVGCG